MIAEDITKMTRHEAIESGYTFCGYPDQEFQTLIKIKDVIHSDYAKPLMLAEKEGTHPKIDAKDLSEIIADHIYSEWGEVNSDSAEEVYNEIKQMDFTDMAEKINEKCKSHVLYILTDIRLIP
jgi:hypothetical protein